MHRRKFLKLSALGLVGSGVEVKAIASEQLVATADRLPGLQLYTLRSLMEKDVARTLASVAKIGYLEVEFSDYFGLDPAQIKKILDAEGLAAPSVHVPLEKLESDLEQTLDAAQRIGHRYLVLPWLGEGRRSADSFKHLADLCNQWGEKCREAGLRFAYHNHDFEFEAAGEFIPYDWLLKKTDPELVCFEMDLFWIYKARKNPLEYFKKYPGRFPMWHVKDMSASGEMVDVGAGVIDFERLLKRADLAGLKHGFVEHDRPKDPLRTAAISLEAARAWRRG